MTNTKLIFFLIWPVIIVTAIDSRIVQVTQQISIESPGIFHLSVFSLFVIIFIISNFFILKFVNNFSFNNQSQSGFKYAYIGISVIQYAISTILAFIILQIVYFTGYSSVISISVIYLSHISAATFLGFLAFRLIYWVKSTPNNLIVIYSISFVLIILLTLISIPYLTQTFPVKPTIIEPRPYRIVKLDASIPDPEIENAHLLSYYIFFALIVVTWIVTVSLLKQYSKRIGTIRYWIILSLPLIYLLFYSIVNGQIMSYVSNSFVLKIAEVELFFQIANQIAGLLFGIAFWIISRKVKREKMQKSLVTTGVGIILLFSSLEVGVIILPVSPPFGLVTMSFMGLASYLLMLGILNCATIVARDADIRKELYKNLENESNLLKSMGQAEMKREIEKKVRHIIDRSNTLEMTDIHNDTLEKEDVEGVINEILTELHSKDDRRTEDKEKDVQGK